jgi:hypothetical protein
MARSYITYTGDGTNQVFSVTFSYIQKDDVTIKVNNLPATFEWLSDSSVKITPAPPNGQVVKISRITDIDGPIVDFQDGANLTESRPGQGGAAEPGRGPGDARRRGLLDGVDSEPVDQRIAGPASGLWRERQLVPRGRVFGSGR